MKENLYLKNVSIENFQSHKKTYIDFDEGFNVITGPSDQGKTAVIRAIRWVMFNEPKGTEYIRQGTDWAKVSITMSNGFTITRERSKTRNRYTVTGPDGKESIFEGFGSDVPLEVLKAHGVQKIVLDTDLTSYLNIAEQFDRPFLIGETGSLRAKAIGRLMGLHIIDKASRDCLADIKRENLLQDRLNKELQGINAEIEKFYKLKETERIVDTLAEIISTLEEESTKLSLLYSSREKLERVENEIHKNNGTVENCEKESEELVGRLSKYLLELGRCPLCGSDIRNDKKEDIIKHFKEDSR